MTTWCVNGFPRLACAALVALAPVGCVPAASTPPPSEPTLVTTSPEPTSRRFHARVLERVATDRADAHGLELVGEVLVENTGMALRAVSPTTGAIRAQQVAPGSSGVALTPAGLWHITGGVTVLRDPVTLVERRRTPAAQESWGLCHDGTHLVQSDGTTKLLLRDPESAAFTGEVVVATREWSTARLGELHCVRFQGRPQVWAAVTGTDWMIRVDLTTGAVSAVADLTAVTIAEQPTGRDQVIGGITAVRGAGDELWLTGRHFGHRYRIRLQPQP